MSVDGIILECKHPNSNGQLERNIAKFARKLRDAGKFGIFAIAVEDANNLGERDAFSSEPEDQAWLEAKRGEMEISGRRRAALASRFENIVGLVHTQSLVLVVGKCTRMQGLGTSMLFDHHESSLRDLTTARAIVEAFDPCPNLYSQAQHLDWPVPEIRVQ